MYQETIKTVGEGKKSVNVAGVEGRGRIKSDARDAAEQEIARMLGGPRGGWVAIYGGQIGVLWRGLDCWYVGYIRADDVAAGGLFSMPRPTAYDLDDLEAAQGSLLMSLAQDAWRYDDPETDAAPHILADHAQWARDYEGWAKWQRAAHDAQAAGIESAEACCRYADAVKYAQGEAPTVQEWLTSQNGEGTKVQ